LRLFFFQTFHIPRRTGGDMIKNVHRSSCINQRQKASSYAINVESKAAPLAISNKHTTHPLVVATRLKTIELRNCTSITFHWVKGHAGLKRNERADYLAKTAASCNTAIAYDAIPLDTGRALHKNLERNIH